MVVIIGDSSLMQATVLQSMRRHLVIHFEASHINSLVEDFFKWSPVGPRSAEYDELIAMLEPHVSADRLSESIHVILSIRPLRPWQGLPPDFPRAVEELRAFIPRWEDTGCRSSRHMSLKHAYLDTVDIDEMPSLPFRALHRSVQDIQAKLRGMTLVDIGTDYPEQDDIQSSQFGDRTRTAIKCFMEQSDPLGRGLHFHLGVHDEWAASVVASLYQQGYEQPLDLKTFGKWKA